MTRTIAMITGALALSLATATVMAADKPGDDPKQATKESPWVNSLNMKFVPVKGTDALFCIWLTRVQDFEVFVKETGYDATKGMLSWRDLLGYGPAFGQERGEDWDAKHPKKEITWKSPGFEQGPTHPVCGVSWEDADAFCKWLTKKEQAEGRLKANQQYRLPKDAEWSVAVGLGPEVGASPMDKDDAGVKGVYPWGTQLPPPKGAGNYAGEELKAAGKAMRYIKDYKDDYPCTSPVDSFAANAFGIHDMGGNLMQWCEDCYLAGHPQRVLRGSSWERFEPSLLLSSYRYNRLPNNRLDNCGFRCVLVVTP